MGRGLMEMSKSFCRAAFRRAHGHIASEAMRDTPRLSSTGKIPAALLLTAIGGFVDAVGWISLSQVFTANMSGNSIHVGMNIGLLNFWVLRPFACALVAFVSGLIVTRVLVEAAARGGVKRIASATLMFEGLLLLAFARATPEMHAGHISDQNSLLYFGLIAALGFAMGVQTATLTHIGPLTVYTTFVTGCLTMFSESFAHTLFWIHDSIKRGRSVTQTLARLSESEDAAAAFLLFCVWSCYVVGAALGTFLKHEWELRALYLPAALLAMLILVDRIRPLAEREEEKQTAGPAIR
jgi:uncharacterized membrane protein YoaK (UPF0700 family)